MLAAVERVQTLHGRHTQEDLVVLNPILDDLQLVHDDLGVVSVSAHLELHWIEFKSVGVFTVMICFESVSTASYSDPAATFLLISHG